ncbi:MAG: alanine--tRNA ligase, partial [Bacteroidia bacterium]|nr:alanine--tRNA ligase [Bacteroidia bacterium]
NSKIQENIAIDEQRSVPIDKAMAQGATALFGEKYGDNVRVITFDKDFSIELCGGTHVNSTGEIGLFKIISEGSVAAGIRRVEGITAEAAVDYVQNQLHVFGELKKLIKNPKDPVKGLQALLKENAELKKELQSFSAQKINDIKNTLGDKVEQLNGIEFISEHVELNSAEAVKQLSFDYIRQKNNTVLLIGAELNQKPHLSLIISEEIVKQYDMNASKIIRELAKEIKGGGGGQNYYATAGGNDASGLKNALDKAKEIIQSSMSA